MKPDKNKKNRYRLEHTSPAESRPEMFVRIFDACDEFVWNPKVMMLEYLLSEGIVINWDRRSTSV